MTFRHLLSVISGIIMFYSFIPYGADILKGKVRPSRSARIMFLLLLIVALLQQRSLGSGWLLAMTVGDGIGAIGILLLALRRGIGGFGPIDIVCYSLLLVDITLWSLTGNALLALHLSALADLIATMPVLIKTWRQPWTETPFFFVLGVIAPLINVLAAGHYTYAVLLFPLYIAAINLINTVLIIWRQQIIPRPAHLTERVYP